MYIGRWFTKRTHICILLDDFDINEHYRCLRLCNFTGSEVPEGEYAIDIRLHPLPDQWFGNKKPTSWIRCNREIDCIKSFDIIEHKVLGNIKDDYRDLWLEVCEQIKNCDISENFNTVCECAFEAIERLIEKGEREPYGCDCKT